MSMTFLELSRRSVEQAATLVSRAHHVGGKQGAASRRCVAWALSILVMVVAVGHPSAASGPDRNAIDRAALKAELLLRRAEHVGSREGKDSWEGSNPLLDLHATLHDRGVTLSRSPQGENSFSCFWALAETRNEPIDRPPAVEVSGARLIRGLRLAREDFLNAEAGLRHVVQDVWEGAIDGPTGLAFRLDTDLTSKLADDGRTLLLLSGGEWVLRYRIVNVTDARGRVPDPRMAIERDSGSRQALIRVLDGSAVMTSWSRIEGIWDTPKSPFEEPADEAVRSTPSNDLCTGAEIIPAAGPFPYTTATTPDVTDATTTGDPPGPSCQPDVSRSIWYRFTPDTSADYTFSVCSNAPTDTTADDTVLAVYAATPDGDCSGSLAEVSAVSPFASCDDDSCVNEAFQSELTVQLELDTTYFILVWQFGSAAPTPGNEAVQLRVSQTNPLPPPPPNDFCSGAETIPGAGPFPHLTTLIDDVRGARVTGDPTAPSCAVVVSRSVWYAITPDESANYTFSTCADAPTGTTLDDTVVAVYASDDGTCGGNLSELAGACDDDGCSTEAFQATVTASLEAGTTYYVVAWQRGSAMPAAGNAAVQVRVTKSIPPPPPSNDQCSGAETIPDGPYPWTTALVDDVTGATTAGDPSEPSCGGSLRSRSLWYRFTPGETASYTISSCAEDGLGTTLDDTVVTIYASDGGGCAGTLTEVSGGCNDDGCGTEDAQSVVTATLAGGTDHYVLVWQKGAGVPGPGNTAVQLQVAKGAVAPTSDVCGGAETIPDGPYPVFSPVVLDITGALTAGDPQSASCQSNRSRGVWYRFVPGTSGYYRVSTCSGDGTLTTVDDTVLALYRSPAGCAGPFEEPATALCVDACDDDSCVTGSTQSSLITYLESATEYFLLVWMFGTDPPAPGSTAVQVMVDRLPQGTPPPNDDCAAAATIPPSGPFPYLADLAADVTSASCAGDPPAPTCEPATSRSVWYELSPDRSGLFSFSTCSDAPTGTTVDDTVIGVYRTSAGCAGPFVQEGCDDDSCGVEALQAALTDLRLDAGETYYVVAWSFGTTPPPSGDTAVQLLVDADFTPANDLCETAVPLLLDIPATGTTVSANDSYRLAGSACFTGIGQSPTTAPGLDATYVFTAPEDDDYSFKVTGYEVGFPQDATLYVSQACEVGPTPVTVASCLAASNRNTGGPSEEVVCLPLTTDETVYVTVDNVDVSGLGSDFTLEVNRCTEESEPNDSTSSPDSPICGIEGSISPAGDVDFYAVGQPAADSRLFALVDGIAANPSNSNFDLRVTTSSETLEYDDSNNDAEFGNVSPNVGGTEATGEALFLRVTQKSVSAEAEPYRLYTVTQAAVETAVAETEPNDTTASADVADYLLATLPGPEPSTDVDVYRFEAARGDLWIIGLDGDPGYDGTPLNAKVEILDDSGAAILTINDSGSTGNARTPAAGLTATSPFAPAEGLSFRVAAAGTYYVRVSAGSGGARTAGDYLLSLAPSCLSADADQDGIPNVTDCAPETPGGSPPGPVEALTLDRDASGDLALSWTDEPDAEFDVTRGELDALRASGFPASAVCAGTDLPDASYLEPAADCPLAPGSGCWYLVRTRNACGVGTFGATGESGAHPLDEASSPCP
jgi:hypothetical protein